VGGVRGRGAESVIKVERRHTEKETSVEHRHETGSGEVSRGSAQRRPGMIVEMERRLIQK